MFKEKFYIGKKIVSNNASPIIIAEGGVNHFGCFKKMKKLIDLANKAGADIFKTQFYHTSQLISSLNQEWCNRMVSKEVDINRECLRLIKQIGVWNDSGEWVPEVFDFGSSRKTAAKHQIPKKDRYIEIQAAIDSAQKIIDGRDTLEDSFQMQAAVRGFSHAYQSATKGDSIRSAYCRYGACVIDDSDSD